MMSGIHTVDRMGRNCNCSHDGEDAKHGEEFVDGHGGCNSQKLHVVYTVGGKVER